MAVHVDNVVTVAQKPAQNVLKHRIPIHDVVLETVHRIDDRILVGVDILPPIGAKGVLGAVDHVGDPVQSDKHGCQVLTRSNEDAWTEPRRGLTKIVGREHCVFTGLVVTRWNAASCYSTPATVKALFHATAARGIAAALLEGLPASCLGNGLHDTHRPPP
jgi:hypothetical protein